MRLSPAQKRLLARDGFVILPRAVPKDRLGPALREINHRLGLERGRADASYAVEQDWLSEHVKAPAVMDLLHRSPIAELIESLLGAGMVEPCSQAQIALRFPADGEARGGIGPHIDGFSANEELHRFTLLVGILLSDVPKNDMGNFAVYPGSHRRVERYSKEHGVEPLREGLAGKIELPEAVQITGKAGDAFLCHHQLAHGKERNLSPYIRYMAYFRVYHVDAWRDKSKGYIERALTDLWLEWPGMRGVHGA